MIADHTRAFLGGVSLQALGVGMQLRPDKVRAQIEAERIAALAKKESGH